LTNLWDVKGEDDFDGDGMSNREEYQAGTFAFLDYDALLVEEVIPAPNARLRLTFLSVPGKTYRVFGIIQVVDNTWQPCAFAVTDAAPLQTVPAEGNGDWLSLYIPLEEPVRFYRVVAE
jgi:hypothetical protein